MSEPISAALVQEVRDQLSAAGSALTPQWVAAALRARGVPVGDATVLAVHEALCREALGAGPLDPLLRLPGVTDVLVNGPEGVYVDRGRGLERTEVGFADDEAVRRLAQRLAAQAGRRLDTASPHVDARLPDGSRFHAVLSPVARPGTLISIRVPRSGGLSLQELGQRGLFDPDAASCLRDLVSSRLPFLVSGGTGSGKTTLLSALLGEAPPGERLVLVEDAWELAPSHPHVVGLEARPANVEGAGEVTLRSLVRQALRMRPDRLVVGEVRGGEVVELLAALNTGHEGGCGTLHANSAADVPARIEALALAGGLGRQAAHAQLAAGVGAILHLVRGRDGGRRLREIAVPVVGGDGLVQMATAYRPGEGGGWVSGQAADRLRLRLAGEP